MSIAGVAAVESFQAGNAPTVTVQRFGTTFRIDSDGIEWIEQWVLRGYYPAAAILQPNWRFPDNEWTQPHTWPSPSNLDAGSYFLGKDSSDVYEWVNKDDNPPRAMNFQYLWYYNFAEEADGKVYEQFYPDGPPTLRRPVAIPPRIAKVRKPSWRRWFGS